MTHGGLGARRRRVLARGVTLLVAVTALPGCAEVESAAVDGYRPSAVEELEGSAGKRITFTEEGARRTGLRTAPVRRAGGLRAVPYEALLYDGQGESHVYAQMGERLSFVRADVTVDRVDGERVLLAKGPPPGTRVVTVGASEVYGTELGIEGGH